MVVGSGSPSHFVGRASAVRQSTVRVRGKNYGTCSHARRRNRDAGFCPLPAWGGVVMLALVLVVVTALLLLAFIYLRRKSPAVLRHIEAYERLNRIVGLAVENGTRLHISLGRGNLFTARGGSALAGLAM